MSVHNRRRPRRKVRAARKTPFGGYWRITAACGHVVYREFRTRPGSMKILPPPRYVNCDQCPWRKLDPSRKRWTVKDQWRWLAR